MWQFDKALRLDLYEQDDVCTNTANNIRSLNSNYIHQRRKHECSLCLRLFHASTQLAIQYPCVLCIHACISPCPVLLQLQSEEFLSKQTRYVTHDA